MNWSDVKIDSVVYHSMHTQWGRGIVVDITGVNKSGKDRFVGSRRAMVRFEGRDGDICLHPRCLRKTPNKAKIQEMVRAYKVNGVDATDGGDRLILPKK